MIPSRTSPKGGKRACLCKNGTYSRKCCDGSLWAQGIGSIHKTSFYLTQEDNTSFILQENDSKIIT